MKAKYTNPCMNSEFKKIFGEDKMLSFHLFENTTHQK